MKKKKKRSLTFCTHLGTSIVLAFLESNVTPIVFETFTGNIPHPITATDNTNQKEFNDE